MPVGGVDGSRMNLQQDFIVLGNRFFYLCNLENIGWSVFCVYHCLHEFPPRLVWRGEASAMESIDYSVLLAQRTRKRARFRFFLTNFRELRLAELRRRPLLRGWVNRGAEGPKESRTFRPALRITSCAGTWLVCSLPQACTPWAACMFSATASIV